jgi:hypothetical protein
MPTPKTKFKVDDIVYVPSHKLPDSASYPYAMVKSKVVEVKGAVAKRSVKVTLPKPPGVSDWIASSWVVADPSILLLKIGDYGTETTLLDPLAKSALQFLRLLLEDGMLLRRDVRSLDELREVWTREGVSRRNVILIGHGAKNGIHFGVDGLVYADELAGVLAPTGGAKSFLSLCCLTGCAAFAKPFSALPVCEELVAPYHSVHGAVASQFLQALLVCRLLRGESPAVAYRHAAERIPAEWGFRRWVAGGMV